MIFFIFIMAILVGVLLEQKTKFEYTGLALWVTGTIFSSVMLVLILIMNFAPDLQEESLKNRQEAITYKIESEIYRDDLNILDKDIITEIKEWNSEIIFFKGVQRDFWAGIFIPNIYDEVETIEYGKIIK